jgi:predicted DNA-binding transcriptional regulator AlpA
MVNSRELVQQQQSLIEELWFRVHGTPFQPTPKQKHTLTTANISVWLMRSDVEDYRAGRIADDHAVPTSEPTPASLSVDPEAYADIDQVAHHLGVSKATIMRMVHDERFPRPDRLSAKRRGWKAGVVRSWPGYEIVMARRAVRTKRPRNSGRRR